MIKDDLKSALDGFLIYSYFTELKLTFKIFDENKRNR